MNMFSVLAETDSEEEVVKEKETVVEDVSDSSYSEEDETTVPLPVESQSPQFRVWKDDSRFSSMKNNVFSSPFSRKKPRRFTKEEEWTSIQVGTAGISPTYSPLTQPSESQNDVPQLNLPPAVFPSLLSRGTSAGVTADDVSEQQNALAWAEKVKQTLERAGQGRSEMKRASAKSDDCNLSFFRRNIVLDEKF